MPVLSPCHQNHFKKPKKDTINNSYLNETEKHPNRFKNKLLKILKNFLLTKNNNLFCFYIYVIYAINKSDNKNQKIL